MRLFATLLLLGAAAPWAFVGGRADTPKPDEVRGMKFPPPGEHWCVVTRIVDADTVTASILVSLDNCRLADIDCPELATAEGKAAKAYLEKILPIGKPVKLRLYDRSKSFNRPIVDVSVDGEWVTKRLLKAGHAVPFQEKP